MADEQPEVHPHFLSLEFEIITEELKKKAESELHETEENLLESLKELKELIQSEKNLNSNTSNEFLLQLLRARKFRTKDAFKVLKNYYKHRVCYPAIYEKYNPQSCKNAMQAKMCNFLPFRAADGSAVWFIRVGSWNPEVVPFEEYLKLGLLCQEIALQNPVTQICGITTVFDMEGVSWSHVRQLHLQNIKCLLSAIEDSFPLRHKRIHIVNNAAIFNIIYMLFTPFVKYKFKSRVFLHGYNFESLHRFLPPSILPEELGGTNGPFGNEKFFNTLLKKSDELEGQLKYGYTM